MLRNFFNDSSFFAEYDCDIENTPDSVLPIPFLAAVAPLVWANQGDIYVNELDSLFLQSLYDVQSTLRAFYPKMNFKGKIIANRVIVTPPEAKQNSKSMVLFSGGVDAIASYIRHKEEKPILFTIHGLDLHSNNFEGWNKIYSSNAQFAEYTHSSLRFVRSNFYHMLSRAKDFFFMKTLEGLFYDKVMQGIAPLGLCAPFAYAENVGKVYLASSEGRHYKGARGSVPEIDNRVRWPGTNCFHDGYEFNPAGKSFSNS